MLHWIAKLVLSLGSDQLYRLHIMVTYCVLGTVYTGIYFGLKVPKKGRLLGLSTQSLRR